MCKGRWAEGELIARSLIIMAPLSADIDDKRKQFDGDVIGKWSDSY